MSKRLSVFEDDKNTFTVDCKGYMKSLGDRK
jgi:hypothetical protein